MDLLPNNILVDKTLLRTKMAVAKTKTLLLFLDKDEVTKWLLFIYLLRSTFPCLNKFSYPSQNNHTMPPRKALRMPVNTVFWDVFAGELPRIPSVNELICRVVLLHYPEGILADKNGKPHTSLTDSVVVKETITQTVNDALDSREAVYEKQLRRNKLYTPYAWGLMLSIGLAVVGATKQVREALDIGGSEALDRLF
jgi:hypothetical protein